MKLREIRTQKGLTQKSVANLLNCSPVVYSRYETGSRQPSVETLLALSDIFKVSVDQLLGKEEPFELRLNGFEDKLIKASRRADERSRQDALHLLILHEIQSGNN